MSFYRIAFVLFGLPLVGFFSCNPEEQEPAYVTFEGFNLTTIAREGSNSSAIETVWVFANNVYLGTYNMPARIPMLLSGPTTLRFEPGVKENGVSARPNIYPFYETVTREVELIPGETVAIGRQNIGYKSEVIFGFIENFEPNEQRIYNTVVVGEDPIGFATNDVFEGDGSGRISLNDSNALVEILADPIFEMLFDRSEETRLWLEMDFKSEAQGLIGISGNDEDGQFFSSYNQGFLERGEWTKIYFNLSEAYFNARTQFFQTGIRAFLPEGVSQADVYFDNIKLVYR
ncbi:MAG: hypothetical protein AAGF87_10560 [Bacteroidota bacterium]